MKNNTIIREANGRILGRIDTFWEDEDSVWFDYKEQDVRFPEYRQNMNGECITYSIEELNK